MLAATSTASAIRVLPPELVARIAAGEVVERPASIVKELVENALDASASKIRVEIESGGTARVRVTDDGSGMSPADLLLSVQPHATSKLDSADQLHRLSTLGFRGEALPSIASVTRFSIVSRQVSSRDPHAWRIELEPGLTQAPQVRPSAGNTGTTVEAADLFFNLPARKKFLKGLASEASACADTFLRLALTRPDVAFSLSQGRSELLALPAVTRSRAPIGGTHSPHSRPALPTAAYLRRARDAFGQANSAGLLELDFTDQLHVEAPSESACRLFGLLFLPKLNAPNRNQIYLTVNGRSVRDRTLTSPLLEAFRHLLPPRRFPRAALFLELPGGDVDINVHPAKSEVRFRVPGRIFALFHHAVRGACGVESQESGVRSQESEVSGHWSGNGAAPGAPPHADLVFPPTGPLLDGTVPAPVPAAFNDAFDVWPASRVSEAPAPFGAPPRGFERNVPRSYASPATPLQSSRTLPTPRRDSVPALVEASARPALDCRVIGQAAGSYIVVEDESGVKLIDQHALHERILFERLMASAASSSRGDAQGLLVPETVELSAAQAALLSASSESGACRASARSGQAVEQTPLALLAHLGFDCTPFGPRTLLLQAIPAILKSASPARLVSELLETLAAGDDAPLSSAKPLKRASLREKTAYILSCKAAIKAGERLTVVQMEALLGSFHNTVGPLSAHGSLTCPHGRPLSFNVSWYELERAVGRK